MTIDLSKVSNLKFEGIDHSDYPDYCDAFIVRANVGNREATEEEIEELNEDRDFVYEKLTDYLN